MNSRQTSSRPTQKLTAAALGGAVTIIGIWVLGLFKVDIPPEVASAFTTVISFIVGYITPPASGDSIVVQPQ